MGTRELTLVNVNEMIRGFLIDSINDTVDEEWITISLPEMRRVLSTVNVEIIIRSIAGRRFAIIHAVRKGGKASALDDNNNVMLMNSFLIAGADIGDSVYMMRSLTDDEICHIKDNLGFMFMQDGGDGYNFIAVKHMSAGWM